MQACCFSLLRRHHHRNEPDAHAETATDARSCVRVVLWGRSRSFSLALSSYLPRPAQKRLNKNARLAHAHRIVQIIQCIARPLSTALGLFWRWDVLMGLGSIRVRAVGSARVRAAKQEAVVWVDCLQQVQVLQVLPLPTPQITLSVCSYALEGPGLGVGVGVGVGSLASMDFALAPVPVPVPVPVPSPPPAVATVAAVAAAAVGG